MCVVCACLAYLTPPTPAPAFFTPSPPPPPAAKHTKKVAEALALAVERGLRLPVVYNSSAYDGASSLALMDGLVVRRFGGCSARACVIRCPVCSAVSALSCAALRSCKKKHPLSNLTPHKPLA